MSHPKTDKNPRGAGARAGEGIRINLNTRIRLSESAALWYARQENKARKLAELIELASKVEGITPEKDEN